MHNYSWNKIIFSSTWKMSDEAIMGCNLPTGIPFVYELDQDLKVRFLLKTIVVGR